MKANHLFCCLLLTIVLAACQKEQASIQTPVPIVDGITEVVPLETAMSTLDSFLQKIDGYTTKSGVQRTIASIGTHYGSRVSTKSGNAIPDAYVVNFDNNQGFAVLGANTSVDDIICLVESGQIDAETLNVILENASYDEYGTEGWPLWSEEDNDYYCYSGAPRPVLLEQLIKNSIEPGSGGSPHPNFDLTEKAPLVHVNWGQSGGDDDIPCNTFCYNKIYVPGAYKDNPSEEYDEDRLYYKGPISLTGCSTTACAMIIATNAFPNKLTINNEIISYTEMKAYPKTNMLSDNGKYHEALLMGAIYNNVTKFCAGPEGTGITPEQIKKILKKLGYTNVMKLSDSDGVSVEMIDEISDMLALNKPLFISALPQNVFNGHSWVIDGAKYSENTYLLHFNFGWSGQSNGYFASSSINPAHPVSPDDKENINGKADYPYKSHFRLIRYDIPGEQTEKTLDFDML